jgi:hypothetical protein
MYDIELSKKREEVYLYLVEQLTKANETRWYRSFAR